MSIRSRQRHDHVKGAYAVTTVAGFALLSLVLAGCAQPRTGSGATGEPPTLHIATGSDTGGSAAMSRDAAPVPIDGGYFGGWVLVGALPVQPTQAAVRRWPDGPASPAEVQRLAQVLGVTGTPARHADGWVVTGATGVLRIRDDGGHQWSYTRADQTECPPITVDVDHPDGATGAACGMAIAPGQSIPAGPSTAATRSMAAPLLAGLGLGASDVAAATVYQGSPNSTLSVSPTVDSMPTQGLETTVYADRTGIAGASGRLDLPTPGDVYPLRTAKQAFEDLAKEPRPMMAPYCGPIPGVPGGTSAGPVPLPRCPSPEPVKVTGARIGLLLTYDMSSDSHGMGVPLMVPAWFFTVLAGGTGPVMIAIDPSFLAPPDQPQPGNPGSVPGGSGSGSDGSAGTNIATPASPPVPAGPPASAGAPASPKH